MATSKITDYAKSSYYDLSTNPTALEIYNRVSAKGGCFFYAPGSMTSVLTQNGATGISMGFMSHSNQGFVGYMMINYITAQIWTGRITSSGVVEQVKFFG